MVNLTASSNARWAEAWPWTAIDSRSCGNCCISIGESAIFRPEQAVGGQVDLVEEQFRRVVAVEPDLVEVAAAGEALVAFLDQEQGNAARAAFLGGARADDDQVGALAVGDVGFGSRQPPAVAVPFRAIDFMPCRSLPALGSVMAMALMVVPSTMPGRWRFFCSSLP